MNDKKINNPLSKMVKKSLWEMKCFVLAWLISVGLIGLILGASCYSLLQIKLFNVVFTPLTYCYSMGIGAVLSLIFCFASYGVKRYFSMRSILYFVCRLVFIAGGTCFFVYLVSTHWAAFYTHKHGRAVQTTPLRILSIEPVYTGSSFHGLMNPVFKEDKLTLSAGCIKRQSICKKWGIVIPKKGIPLHVQDWVTLHFRATQYAVVLTSIVNAKGKTIKVPYYLDKKGMMS